MKLKKIKLGKYIETYSKRCNIQNLTNDDISGVNKYKEFFEPSNQIGSDTSNYKIVPPDYFACNLMHVGRDVVLPIAYNHSKKDKIVSPAYTVFSFKENDELLSEYFFLSLKSDEKDRYFWFNTDSSVRDGMSWDEFINVEIELPPVNVQRKYISVYNSLLENLRIYEDGLENLELIFSGYIENLKKIYPSQKIEKYIIETRCKNENAEKLQNKAVSNKKIFVDAKESITNGVETRNYLIVNPKEFAYNTVTTRNADKLSIAFNDGEKCLVSPLYTTFKISSNELLPEYLNLWFKRSEYDRYARFESWGSARELFSFKTLSQTKMPIPDVNVQKSIVDIYNTCIERRKISYKLKDQINNICSILIKGSIEEAKRLKEE